MDDCELVCDDLNSIITIEHSPLSHSNHEEGHVDRLEVQPSYHGPYTSGSIKEEIEILSDDDHCKDIPMYDSQQHTKLSPSSTKCMFDRNMHTNPSEIPIHVSKRFKKCAWSNNCSSFKIKKFKKPRTAISLPMKLDIINYAHNNPHLRQAEVANIYGIDRTAVNKILKRSLEIKAREESLYQYDGINQRKNDVSTLQQLQLELQNWLMNYIEHNTAIHISDQLIKERAILLSHQYGINGFDPTDKWIRRIRRNIEDGRPKNLFSETGTLITEANDELKLYWDTSRTKEIATMSLSNNVSELLGQKMLLGWRMLANNCDSCATVLMQDRNGKRVCVCCDELDMKPPLEAENSRDKTTTSRGSSEICSNEQFTSMDESASKSANIRNPLPAVSLDSLDLIQTTSYSLDVLVEKLKQTTDRLRDSHDVDTNLKLCNLIKSLAEAILSIKHVYMSSSK